MGLIEEHGEGQPEHEGGRGDESPGEKEEPQQRSRQPEFPSWQVSFSSQTVPRKGRAGTGRGLLAEDNRCTGRMGWEGMLPAPKGGQQGQCWGPAAGACVGNLIEQRTLS